MPYFPQFIDIKDKEILVVGAGNIAARKIEKLALFGPKIKIVATRANAEVEGWVAENSNLCLEIKSFEFSDIGSPLFVIVAADDIPLQKQIYEFCLKKGIPCNCVDSPKYCSFIFPALVVRGDLCVGINTTGKAPYLSRRIREILDHFLPQELKEVVEKSHEYREAATDKKIDFQKIKNYVEDLIQKIEWRSPKV